MGFYSCSIIDWLIRLIGWLVNWLINDCYNKTTTTISSRKTSSRRVCSWHRENGAKFRFIQIVYKNAYCYVYGEFRRTRVLFSDSVARCQLPLNMSINAVFTNHDRGLSVLCVWSCPRACVLSSANACVRTCQRLCVCVCVCWCRRSLTRYLLLWFVPWRTNKTCRCRQSRSAD